MIGKMISLQKLFLTGVNRRVKPFSTECNPVKRLGFLIRNCQDESEQFFIVKPSNSVLCIVLFLKRTQKAKCIFFHMKFFYLLFASGNDTLDSCFSFQKCVSDVINTGRNARSIFEL